MAPRRLAPAANTAYPVAGGNGKGGKSARVRIGVECLAYSGQASRTEGRDKHASDPSIWTPGRRENGGNLPPRRCLSGRVLTRPKSLACCSGLMDSDALSGKAQQLQITLRFRALGSPKKSCSSRLIRLPWGYAWADLSRVTPTLRRAGGSAWGAVAAFLLKRRAENRGENP